MEHRLNSWIRFWLPLFLTLFLGSIIFMMAQFREPPRFTWYALLWFAATVFLIWEGGWWIGHQLDKHYSWKNGIRRRLIVQLLATNIFGIALFLGTYTLLNFYENFVLGFDNPLSILHLLVATGEAFFIVQILNSVQISYQLLRNWQATQLAIERLKKENAVKRLDHVRQQLKPGFITDHLLDLKLLLDKAPDKVKALILEISESYRLRQTSLDSSLAEVQRALQVKINQETSTLPDITPHKKYRQRFLVKSGPKMIVIPIEDIALIYKDDIVLIWSREGKKYPLDYSLEELARMLPPQSFFRINRQQILHLTSLTEIRPEGNQMTLQIEPAFPERLTVSQRNIPQFKRWLQEEEI